MSALEQLIEFVNTNDVQASRDQLRGPEEARSWLTAHGLEVTSTTPAGRALAPLVGAIMSAQADGSWARVKACARDSCRWLFYDTTRNHSRTWCTNSTCGSREKAKRAYRRQLQKDARGQGRPAPPHRRPPAVGAGGADADTQVQ